MKNYARVINDIAVDISSDPSRDYHPTLAEQFIEVPKEVSYRWTLVKGVWTKPAPIFTEIPAANNDPIPTPNPIPPTPVPVSDQADRRITRLAFLQRFTLTERLGIRAARTSDPMIDDFLIMTEAATFIDLSREDTTQALGYLMSKGLLTTERVASILSTDVKVIERPEGM